MVNRDARAQAAIDELGIEFTVAPRAEMTDLIVQMLEKLVELQRRLG